MVQLLARNWWTFVLRGILAIVFGILAFIWPTITALALVYLFAIFAFVEGIWAFVGAFSWGLSGSQRFLMIVMGLLGLAVGVGAVLYPGITALTIVIFVAWWAIITGVMQFVVAFEMRKVIENEWLLVLSGLLSIVFGILLLWRPLAGILTLTWLFGFYAILFGIFMLSLGFRVKSVGSALT
jgi:uncharacterized membrane protein HdeD (DUF308 family)